MQVSARTICCSRLCTNSVRSAVLSGVSPTAGVLGAPESACGAKKTRTKRRCTGTGQQRFERSRRARSARERERERESGNSPQVSSLSPSIRRLASTPCSASRLSNSVPPSSGSHALPALGHVRVRSASAAVHAPPHSALCLLPRRTRKRARARARASARTSAAPRALPHPAPPSTHHDRLGPAPGAVPVAVCAMAPRPAPRTGGHALARAQNKNGCAH